MGDRQNRPRVNWEPAKRFENETFVVHVNRLPLRFPKFSISISSKMQDGRESRFIPVQTQGQGKIEIIPVIGGLIDLIDQAEEFCRVELQVIEDKKIDEMQARELREANRGKREERPGLKKLSKIDAVKHHTK